MDFQSFIQENIEIQDTELENNNDIVKVKISNVNNRIDNVITTLNKQRHELIQMSKKISTLEESVSKVADEIQKLKKGNVLLDDIINEKKNGVAMCSHLQESQTKAERELEEAQKEIATLREEVKSSKTKRDSKHIEHKNESLNIAQETVICTLYNVIGTMSKELLEEKIEKERCMEDLEKKKIEVEKLTQKLQEAQRENETLKTGQAEMFTNVSQEKPSTKFLDKERDMRQNDVDNTSDFTQLSSRLKMIF